MRYEKGRKDASRRHIMEVASEKFRGEGIAASGLAGIMSDAGLTNGAFYPHFRSKADLVREVLDAAFKEQSTWLETCLATGGLEAAIATYSSRSTVIIRVRAAPPQRSCPNSPGCLPMRVRSSRNISNAWRTSCRGPAGENAGPGQRGL